MNILFYGMHKLSWFLILFYIIYNHHFDRRVYRNKVWKMCYDLLLFVAIACVLGFLCSSRYSSLYLESNCNMIWIKLVAEISISSYLTYNLSRRITLQIKDHINKNTTSKEVL